MSAVGGMNITKTVEEAVHERVEYIFNEFEDIIVSISGGKDSTVLAYLMLKEANRRNRKIGLFFLDEEVVYESTINQIKYLMNLCPDNTIPMWFQIEFHLTNATSYSEGQLVSWESGKHKIWMRRKEKNTIQHKPWDIENEHIRDKA